MRGGGIRPVVAVAAVVALVVVALGAASGPVLHTHPVSRTHLPGSTDSGSFTTQPPTTVTRSVKPQQLDQRPTHSRGIDVGGVVLLVLGLLLLAGITVVAAFVLSESGRHRGRRGVSVELDSREALRTAAVSARALIEGDDPRTAVIRSWLALEDAAAGQGLELSAAETSAELTARVLTAYDVDAAALDDLRALFQRARFSAAEVDEDDRDEARELLGRVADDLARTPVAQEV